MRILVTGDRGFIGSHLVEELIKKNNVELVVGVDLCTYAANKNLYFDGSSKYVAYPYLDINSHKILDILQTHNITHIINCAAESIPEHIFLPIKTTNWTNTISFKDLWNIPQKSRIVKTENGEAIFFNGVEIKAMSFLNGGQWMPIKAITRHRYNGKICKLIQKFGVIEATPNHSIYASNLQLTNPSLNPELLVIRHCGEIGKKYKNCDKRILTLLAFYITEGNTTFNKANGSYTTEISNKNRQQLEYLVKIGRELYNLNGSITPSKDGVYHLQFHNKALFYQLREKCGFYSTGKKFPSFIFDLEPELKEFFWQELLKGDGDISGRYTTTSFELANQLSLLLTLLNKDFKIHERKISETHKNIVYTIDARKISGQHYGLNNKRYTEIDYDGWVYDLEIDKTHNFVCGLGNVVCHNTHVDNSISGPDVFIKTNINGTYNLLKLSLQYGKIKKFVNVSCYDETTRALTKEGIKSYNEIKIGDEVFTLNPQTEQLEWKKVEDVIIQSYEGPMISIKNKRCDFLVTPNHRMLIRNENNHVEFAEASSLINKKYTIPRGTWSGTEDSSLSDDLLYLSGIFIGDGCISNQIKKRPSKTGLTHEEYLQRSIQDKTTGRFISMDKVGAKEYNQCKSTRIFLYIPNQDKSRMKVENALNRLGIKWKGYNYQSRHGTGGYIYTADHKFNEWCQQFGHLAKNKHIPRKLLDLSPKQLKCILEGIIDSDGYRLYINGSARITTVSSQLLQDIIEIAFKIGFGVSYITNKDRNRKAIIKGREIKLRGNSYSICLSINEKRVNDEVTKYTPPEKRIVWCLKVQDNKNFLTIRNGKVDFCGNTDEVMGSLGFNDPPFDLKTQYQPNSPYSASKAAADLLTRAYYKTYQLPTVITNCSNNFGPRQFPEKLIPLAINRLKNNQKIPIYGNGLNVRDWIYVKDHVRALIKVLESGKIGQRYLIGGDMEISNIDLLQKIVYIYSYLTNTVVSEPFEYVEDRKGHDLRYAIDTKPFIAEFGQINGDFNMNLASTVQSYL